MLLFLAKNSFLHFSADILQHYFICFYRDISPENNKYGVAIVQDETVFPSKKVECVGQIIGIVIAKNQAIAQTAAKKVKFISSIFIECDIRIIPVVEFVK